MLTSIRADDLWRIRGALDSVADLVSRTDRRGVSVDYSNSGDPVTTLDREINRTLHENLPAEGEGWLSEESQDDAHRLRCPRVWVVDPIDGTREFVEGIPEWCVSVALVEEHQAVAGGILNPSTGEMFLGCVKTGLEVVGPVRSKSNLAGRPSMLVSRREHRQGKWARFEGPELTVSPIGSIAYRLALVAAGYSDATCTFEPRSEWDVAGGVALVHAAGGTVQMLDGSPVLFNKEVPRVETFFAFGKNCPSLLPQICGLRVGSQGR
jgi:myo-inositol-1(or 4)-monophosphatase